MQVIELAQKMNAAGRFDVAQVMLAGFEKDMMELMFQMMIKKDMPLESLQVSRVGGVGAARGTGKGGTGWPLMCVSSFLCAGDLHAGSSGQRGGQNDA
jgi:hypothetical protein